jgi:hypothetical protein
LLERFGRTMRENLTSGSISFRKAYLQSVIEVIEVDDTQIRIKARRRTRKSGPREPEWDHSGVRR